MLDFSYPMYNDLILFLKNNNYQFFTFDQYFSLKIFQKPIVILRHDVDRFPNKALALAALEKEHGISSTYFFRVQASAFSEKVITSISNMGHEIGYHYEDLCNSNGDLELAWDFFKENINKLRKVANIRSISMHGRPFSKWNSTTLWEYKNYKELELFDANLDINWNVFSYFTDVGRGWNGNLNYRDKVKNMVNLSGCSTDKLIAYLINNPTENLVISTHPERWSNSLFEWTKSFSLDFITSKIKKYFILEKK